MGKIIGIDLGTTNSLVAVMEGNEPVLISSSLGDIIMKSAVKIEPGGQCVVGNVAYRGRILDPTHTFTSIKRFIGRKYHEVFDLVSKFSYSVVIGPNDLACIRAHGDIYTPQAISAMILITLKKAAEDYLGQEVTDAVITVPAYFSERQRIATKEAGEMAGLNVRRIILEPTAAALAYGLDKGKQDMRIAVFDLGGGTFDISILELGDGVFEVKAISGDGFLGGDDFDYALEKWIIDEIRQLYELDVSGDKGIVSLIRDAAHKAKIELSSALETSIDIPFLRLANRPMVNISLPISREKFEQICEELFERLIPPCEEAMRNAGLSPLQIDKVIMVGGATRMPKIREIVLRQFQREPTRNINPDEAVAIGAAIQGAVLTGEVKDVLLLDVTPASLGVEDENGYMIRMIDANTTIPAKKSEVFTTIEDNQNSVYVNILEGENALAIDNRSLGYLVLEDIPAAPAGVPQIEVIFDIDANGILHAVAKDKGTGREIKIRVEVSSGLTADAKDSGMPLLKDV